jgi:methyl-accepting chemotaxis protein
LNNRAGLKRRFADLSVRTKLFLGFGAVLVLLCVSVAMGISSMSTMNTDANAVALNALPSVRLIDSVTSGEYGFRRAQLESSIVTSASANTYWTAQLAQTQAATTALLGGYAKDVSDLTDGRLWATARSDWQRYLAATSQFLYYSNKNLNTKAQAILDGPASAVLTSSLGVLGQWSAYNDKLAKQEVASSQSAYSTARNLSLIIADISILVAVAITLLLSGSIKRGVLTILDRLRSLQDHCATDLRKGIDALAAGDLTISVKAATTPIEHPANDEIGQVAQAVNGIRDRLAATIDAYNQTRANLSELVGGVSGSAGRVSVASREMATTSEETGRATSEIAHAVGDVAQGAERQVRMVETAKSAAEDVARAVTESAENASKAAEVAHETRQIAREGIGAATEANDAMRSVSDSSEATSGAIRELAAKSDQIGAIVKTITGIAEQTNLLALNAAIEAARAGEQGRGFAVVAEEVRKLAEESQHASQEISVLIGAIQSDTTKAVSVVEDGAKRTADGAAVVEKTREAFERIEASVDDMTSRIEQIAAAAQQIAASATSMQESIAEVAAVAEQSSASTEQVSASTQETTASAQEIAASAQALAGNADELNRLVAQFKTTA